MREKSNLPTEINKRRTCKYQDELLTAQDLARNQKLGIWSILVK